MAYLSHSSADWVRQRSGELQGANHSSCWDELPSVYVLVITGNTATLGQATFGRATVWASSVGASHARVNAT
eukprot:3879974-Rhodomonas_salina.1